MSDRVALKVGGYTAELRSGWWVVMDEDDVTFGPKWRTFDEAEAFAIGFFSGKNIGAAAGERAGRVLGRADLQRELRALLGFHGDEDCYGDAS